VNCAETIQDRLGQPAYETALNVDFNGVWIDPLA